MTAKRVGCYYCFRTLDPQDKKIELQTFVKCGQCAATYHLDCWHQVGQCLSCGYHQVNPIEIPPPLPLQAVWRPKAIPIKPAEIIYIDQNKVTHKTTTFWVFGSVIIVAFIWWVLANFVSLNTNIEDMATATAVAKISFIPTSSTSTPTHTRVPISTPTSVRSRVTLTIAPELVALCDEIYLAQAGDSMSKIANRFLGELLAFNLIIEMTAKAHTLDPSFARLNDPNELEVGDKLCIPTKPSESNKTLQPTATPTKNPSTTPTHPTETPQTIVNHIQQITATPRPTTTPKPEPTPVSISCEKTVEGEFADLWYVYREQLGCPRHSSPAYGQFVELPFERGHLFWIGDIDIFGNAKQIIATFGGQNEGDRGSWSVHPDSWNGEGICNVPAPPAGLYLPDRGIAKVWCEIDGINRLGYATAPGEFAPNRGTDAIQHFEEAVIFKDSDGHSKGLVYVLLWDSMTYFRVSY